MIYDLANPFLGGKWAKNTSEGTSGGPSAEGRRAGELEAPIFQGGAFKDTADQKKNVAGRERKKKIDQNGASGK